MARVSVVAGVETMKAGETSRIVTYGVHAEILDEALKLEEYTKPEWVLAFIRTLLARNPERAEMIEAISGALLNYEAAKANEPRVTAAFGAERIMDTVLLCILSGAADLQDVVERAGL